MESIYIIYIILFILIVVGIVLLYIYKDNLCINGNCICFPGYENIDGKCVPVCASNEERLDGKCVPLCPNGQERIPHTSTGKCYPLCPNGQEHIFENNIAKCVQICNESQIRCGDICGDNSMYVCVNNTLYPKCGDTKCENNEVCKDNKCIPDTSCKEPNQLCGTECGDPKKCKDNKLCSDDIQCFDTDGKLLNICYDSNRCTTKDNKTAICCDNSNYILDNGKCKQKCGNALCDVKTQTCFNGNDPTKSYCYINGCPFLNYNYDPPTVYIPGTQESILVCKGEGNNSNKLYYLPSNFNGKNTELTIQTLVNSNSPDASKCDAGSCKFKLSEQDVINTSFNNNICQGKALCSTILNRNISAGKDYSNICPINPGSCCYNNLGKPTGQICINGNKCYKDYCICADPNNTNQNRNCLNQNDLNNTLDFCTNQKCIFSYDGDRISGYKCVVDARDPNQLKPYLLANVLPGIKNDGFLGLNSYEVRFYIITLPNVSISASATSTSWDKYTNYFTFSTQGTELKGSELINGNVSKGTGSSVFVVGGRSGIRDVKADFYVKSRGKTIKIDISIPFGGTSVQVNATDNYTNFYTEDNGFLDNAKTTYRYYPRIYLGEMF